MNYELLKARAISFSWSVLSLVGTTLVAMLVSPEFVALVTQHFGEGVTGSLILMAVTELVKHFRNVRVLGKATRYFGSDSRGQAEARASVTLI